MNNQIKPIYLVVTGAVLIFLPILLGGALGIVGSALGTAGLLFFFIGLAGMLTKKSGASGKEGQQKSDDTKIKGKNKTTYWVLSIVAVIIGLFVYGVLSANKDVDSNSTNTNTSKNISGASWSPQEITKLTNQCVKNVTKENLGYSQKQINDYCSCNTASMVQKYSNPNKFYSDQYSNKVYDEASLICADSNLN